MDELKPCPFCLGKAVVVATSSCSGHIACIGKCRIETKKFWDDQMTSKEDERTKWYTIALETWNRREKDADLHLSD